MKRFLSASAAAVLSAALLVSAPSFAQTQTADAVMTGMSELGINTEGMVLTEEQVLQVEAILSGTDPDADKVAQINQLLGL